MKPRRVIVTMELETDTPLKVLRDKNKWKDVICLSPYNEIYVRQVQVNVVQEKLKK